MPRREESDTRLAAQHRAALAPMTLRKEPEDLTALEHTERRHESATIAFTTSHRERAGRAHDVAEQRIAERLDLRHITHGQIERDRDERWIFPVDVVRHEDVGTALRQVLTTLDTNANKRHDDGADRWEQDAPQPQTLDRPLWRAIRDHAVVAGRVTIARTCSNAWPTDRPSVCTTIASSAVRSGATFRSVSIRSRRRISCSSSCRGRTWPREHSSSSRRLARSAADAVRKILQSASGSTTVPMSRPTMTTRPRRASSRCCSSIASRTAGTRATCETLASTCVERMSQVTSAPSNSTV